uniref:Uncharacterized protein n=1 Tax=Lactuca sativa TaxID=4236 RepID=A0A9R1XAQ1_LACSA|nr:hypothetical protein LSAT_V11C500270890 [Lactuca sativa]
MIWCLLIQSLKKGLLQSQLMNMFRAVILWPSIRSVSSFMLKKITVIIFFEFLLDLVGQKKDAGGWFCGVVIYVVCSCVDHEGSLLLVVLSVC